MDTNVAGTGGGGSPRLDGLVLDGGTRQSLVTVRSLGRRGLAVGALETFAHAPAFSSRWCRARFVCPDGYGTPGYLLALEDALARTEASFIIPAHDGTIDLLRRQRERLQRSTRIALADEPSISIAIDKARTLAVADELRIATPPGVLVASPSDLPQALGAVGLPAVMKPCESWVAREGTNARLISRLVTTPEEVCRAFTELARYGEKVLFQRFLGGRREAVSLLYADGTVYARFAQWAQRTVPPLGGDSVLRQSIRVPSDVGQAAERLVRALDLEGYSEVEFRRDLAGVPYLMEINPRLSASVEIAVRSGVDFPALVKQWAMGESIDRVETYRTGGWMRYLGGDVRGTIETIRQRGRPGIPGPSRAIWDFGAAFLRPMGYDFFEWRDPMPALTATGGFVRRSVSHLMKGNAPSVGRSHHGEQGEGDVPTARAPRTT